MALMLLQKEATVTVCHAKTRDLAQHTILADILIVAARVRGLGQWAGMHLRCMGIEGRSLLRLPLPVACAMGLVVSLYIR